MKRLSPLLIVAAVFALRALAQVVDITQLNTPTNVYSDGGGVWITGGSVNATVPVPIGVVILDGGNLGTTAYQGTSPWVTSGTSTATIVQPIAVVILDGGNLGVTAYQGTSPWSDNIADVGGSAAVTAKTGVLQVGVIGGDGGYVGVYEAVQPIGVTIVDGGNIFATLVGTSPVSVGATISQPLGVTIVDGGNIFATLSGNNYVQAVIDGGVAVGGWAGAAPISIQGSADGGLPVAITGTITATVGTPQGVTILDGGNLFAAVQGTAGGVPVVIQGAADGGLPVAVQLSSGPGSDGGFGVSGTVTATQGTAAATSAPWPVEITDGTNGVGAVKAASTAAVAADRAQVVAVSPNNTVQVQGGGGGAPLSIQGSADGGLPVAITGTITATVATPQGVTILDGGNLFAAVQGTAGGLPISVQGSADGGLPLNVAGAVTVSGTVTATVAGGTVQGTAAGAPISVQGSADGGLALNVDISSGPLSDGGVACSNAVAANLNADVILASGPGSDGGWAVSNATAANLNATCQGAAGGVPISIQGAADGGFPVYSNDLADNKIDAGVGTWAQVTSGLTGTNGTTPTAAPAGVTLPNLVNQDGVQYVHIGPPNAIHYYESTSSEALVIVAPATGTSYYLTDWTLSCGTTAQEVKLLDCDAGTIVTYEDVYCAASGGATHSQISPVRIVAGKSVCCDPVGGTTATCTTDGYVAP